MKIENWYLEDNINISNEIWFLSVHEIMNTSGLLQS